MALAVAHRTICRDDRTVVVGREVTHYDHDFTAVVVHLPTLVGLHIDVAFALLVARLTLRLRVEW